MRREDVIIDGNYSSTEPTACGKNTSRSVTGYEDARVYEAVFRKKQKFNSDSIIS